MNRAEVVALCRIVRAYCPAQAMDEYTPDAWFDVLCGLRSVDAVDAVKHLARSQSFIDPSQIRARVRYVRHDREERGRPSLVAPDWIGELEDGPAQTIAYEKWLDRELRSLADGNPPPTPRALAGMPDDARAAIRAALTPPPAEPSDQGDNTEEQVK